MTTELDKAREAATVQCDHEWPGSHLIPRCGKCGHTEATILYLNQGIRQGFDAGLATATAKIEALEAKLAESERLCDAEVFAVVYSNYDPLEIDSLWATEQLAMDHRERLNDSMWTVVRMTVHSTPTPQTAETCNSRPCGSR